MSHAQVLCSASQVSPWLTPIRRVLTACWMHGTPQTQAPDHLREGRHTPSAMWDEWTMRLTPQKVLWGMGGVLPCQNDPEDTGGKVTKVKSSTFGKLENAGRHKEEIKNSYSPLTWQKPVSCFLIQELKAIQV